MGRDRRQCPICQRMCAVNWDGSLHAHTCVGGEKARTLARFENDLLRPAVLKVLSEASDVAVHVAPIEKLTRLGRRRSPAELGAGTPDLLCSLRWRAGGEIGAAWLCFELKAPPCPAGDRILLCPRCLTAPPRGVEVASASCTSCGSRRRLVDRWSPGAVSEVQEAEHRAWRSAGRWVYVVTNPAEVTAGVEECRRRLRRAGLEPLLCV